MLSPETVLPADLLQVLVGTNLLWHSTPMLFGESKKNTPIHYLSFPGQYANKYEKHD